MLEILLHLKIKEVNLDQEKENEIKQKKLLSQKHTLLSKREKKVIKTTLNLYAISMQIIIKYVHIQNVLLIIRLLYIKILFPCDKSLVQS